MAGNKQRISWISLVLLSCGMDTGHVAIGNDASGYFVVIAVNIYPLHSFVVIKHRWQVGLTSSHLTLLALVAVSKTVLLLLSIHLPAGQTACPHPWRPFFSFFEEEVSIFEGAASFLY